MTWRPRQYLGVYRGWWAEAEAEAAVRVIHAYYHAVVNTARRTSSQSPVHAVVAVFHALPPTSADVECMQLTRAISR